MQCGGAPAHSALRRRCPPARPVGSLELDDLLPGAVHEEHAGQVAGQPLHVVHVLHHAREVVVRVTVTYALHLRGVGQVDDDELRVLGSGLDDLVDLVPHVGHGALLGLVDGPLEDVGEFRSLVRVEPKAVDETLELGLARLHGPAHGGVHKGRGQEHLGLSRRGLDGRRPRGAWRGLVLGDTARGPGPRGDARRGSARIQPRFPSGPARSRFEDAPRWRQRWARRRLRVEAPREGHLWWVAGGPPRARAHGRLRAAADVSVLEVAVQVEARLAVGADAAAAHGAVVRSGAAGAHVHHVDTAGGLPVRAFGEGRATRDAAAAAHHDGAQLLVLVGEGHGVLDDLLDRGEVFVLVLGRRLLVAQARVRALHVGQQAG
mmetsp:Transcript_19310/g.56916  ORF Transcript_19310/g.56916 Transcript_19310/m.56916 type:complete len:376 (+) Transcript_19310:66-1193(+)